MIHRWVRRLLRPLVVRWAWELTTHDGFYTPCDDEWHCLEVRRKARAWGARTHYSTNHPSVGGGE